MLKFRIHYHAFGVFINRVKKNLSYIDSIVRSGHVMHTFGTRTRKFARFHRLSRRR